MEAGIVIHAPDTSIIQSNDRASEILGLSHDQLKGKIAIDPNWKFVKLDNSPLPITEYPVNRISTSKAGMKNQLLGLFRPDKDDIVWVMVNGSPLLSNTGDIIEIAISFVDITGQKQIEEGILTAQLGLEKSQKKLSDLNVTLNQAQELTHVGSWSFNLATQKIEWSDEMFRIWGFDSKKGAPDFDELVNRIHPDDQDLFSSSVDKAARLGTPYDFEHRICLPNEAQKVIRAICHPILRDSGEVVGLGGISQDITDSKIAEGGIKKSLEEKELLLRELYHRTKNNMQVISSMLSIQSQYTNNVDVKETLEDMKSRIMGMALVHEKLYQAKDLSWIDLKDYIIDLVELLKGSLLSKSSNLEIITNLENTRTNIDTAIPCGIIINELFTNAIKHGFSDNSKGVIKISLTNNGDEICVSVLDNGVGIPTGFDFKNHDSYGLNSIIMLSEHQLGGSITLNTENDTEFILKFKEPLNSERV